MKVARGCAALVWGVLALSCGRHLYNADDLQVDAFKHNTDLRWGRLENAAQRVTPEMRRAFVTSWVQRSSEIELQDIEITGMDISVDGDAADLGIVITWVDRETMAVKVTPVTEHWVRTDDGWRCSQPATLPVTVSPATPPLE